MRNNTNFRKATSMARRSSSLLLIAPVMAACSVINPSERVDTYEQVKYPVITDEHGFVIMQKDGKTPVYGRPLPADLFADLHPGAASQLLCGPTTCTLKDSKTGAVIKVFENFVGLGLEGGSVGASWALVGAENHVARAQAGASAGANVSLKIDGTVPGGSLTTTQGGGDCNCVRPGASASASFGNVVDGSVSVQQQVTGGSQLNFQ